MRDPICKINDSVANAVNCTRFIYETTDVQSTQTLADSHVLGIIVKGSGSIVCEDTSATLREGDVYALKKGCLFSIFRDGDMEYSYISFSGFRGDELMDYMEVSGKFLVFPMHGEILDFWLSCFNGAENGNLGLFSEAALLYSVATLSKKTKAKNDISERIVQYANENFSDPNLSMADIAKKLGYDSKYLSALFKAKRGMKFTEYLRSIRIKHAAFLFENGIESVKSVAILSGFSDSLYFSRMFKRETGINPTDYMKNRT